uniref:uncharacterized protein LOC120343360 isoform X1 n=1 Tax=Styela clava TaxID=7725 RepID=UPI00193A94C1|nr:uncharacterized protein LOC120343360 isoform X1 [Styela clava]
MPTSVSSFASSVGSVTSRLERDFSELSSSKQSQRNGSLLDVNLGEYDEHQWKNRPATPLLGRSYSGCSIKRRRWIGSSHLEDITNDINGSISKIRLPILRYLPQRRRNSLSDLRDTLDGIPKRNLSLSNSRAALDDEYIFEDEDNNEAARLVLETLEDTKQKIDRIRDWVNEASRITNLKVVANNSTWTEIKPKISFMNYLLDRAHKIVMDDKKQGLLRSFPPRKCDSDFQLVPVGMQHRRSQEEVENKCNQQNAWCTAKKHTDIHQTPKSKTSANIGPDGGELRIGNSAILKIPAGALIEPTEISIEVIDPRYTTSEEGFYDITPTVRCSPDGLTFPEDKPAHLSLATWAQKPINIKNMTVTAFSYSDRTVDDAFSQSISIHKNKMVEIECQHFSRKKVAIKKDENFDIRLQYFLCCDSHDNFTTVCIVSEEYHVQSFLDKHRFCEILIPPSSEVVLEKNQRFTSLLEVFQPTTFNFLPNHHQSLDISDKFLKEKGGSINSILSYTTDDPAKIIYDYFVNEFHQKRSLKWPVQIYKGPMTENRNIIKELNTMVYGETSKIDIAGGEYQIGGQHSYGTFGAVKRREIIEDIKTSGMSEATITNTEALPCRNKSNESGTSENTLTNTKVLSYRQNPRAELPTQNDSAKTIENTEVLKCSLPPKVKSNGIIITNGPEHLDEKEKKSSRSKHHNKKANCVIQ